MEQLATQQGKKARTGCRGRDHDGEQSLTLAKLILLRQIMARPQHLKEMQQEMKIMF